MGSTSVPLPNGFKFNFKGVTDQCNAGCLQECRFGFRSPSCSLSFKSSAGRRVCLSVQIILLVGFVLAHGFKFKGVKGDARCPQACRFDFKSQLGSLRFKLSAGRRVCLSLDSDGKFY